jgi:hypothetical protein
MTTGREDVQASPPALVEAAALPPLIADFYEQAPPTVRRRLLDSLLRPVGPLALGAIAAGAFADLVPTTRWTVVRASLDDALRISAAHVLELARYVEQKNPDVLWQLPGLVDESQLLNGSISGALLLLAMRCWMQARR